MRIICSILLLIITLQVYGNPRLPSFTISEFGFNEKGWIIELTSDYWPSENKLQIISKSDTSDFFEIRMGEGSRYCVITNDSINNSFKINPLKDSFLIHDSLGWCFAFFGFGPGGSNRVTPKLNQSISLWHKSLGKTFYYLDNSPTFGFPNDSLGAMGILNGTIKDTLGHSITNLKVYYDYETYYGGVDIYVTTDDSGHFSINHFSEYLTLKFKQKYFYDDRYYVQIYPDSTVNISIVIKTDILSDVETDYLISGFRLEQNYPNPFNPVTKIKYTIPVRAYCNTPLQNVLLKVYDMLGNEVATQVNEEQPAGEYEVEFDGSNLSSGIYFYRLSISDGTGSFVGTKKMCVIK